MATRHFLHYAVMTNNAEKAALLYPKKGASRSYLRIDNRSGFDIYVNFEAGANPNLDGIKIATGTFVEWAAVAPDNIINIAGSQATDQRINVTEAY